MTEYITCTSGDWKVLKYNGIIVHEGHDIPEGVWMDFLKNMFGEKTKSKLISDKKMESGKY